MTAESAAVRAMEAHGLRHAVVLSGGGARGAYEIGVLQALYEGASPATAGHPLAARIFSGTSVGAFNAAFLAQQASPSLASVELLTAIWRGRIASTAGSCGNGIYRLRVDPLRWFDPGCLRNPFAFASELARDLLFGAGYAAAYGTQLLSAEGPPSVRALESFNLAALFSREPLESLLAETIDLSLLRAAPNDLSVVVSDWQRGGVRVFRKADLVERVGTAAIVASAAIPGIFAPVEIEATPYVDGGLLMNTPLKPAIYDGADVLHVVFVDPEVSAIDFPELPNTLDTFYRTYAILLAAQINSDARFVAVVNEELAELESDAVAAGGELPAIRARRAVTHRRARADLPTPAGKVYQPIVVHKYRPAVDLTGAEAYLDFRLATIERLIQQGYDDARRHDCEKEKCVLPSKVPVAAGPRGRRR